MKIDDISVGDRLSYQYQDDEVSWTQTVTVQNVKPSRLRVTITYETAGGGVDEKDVSPKTLSETFYG